MSAARSDAWVVFDLGFGDAGKGTMTDWLARTRGTGLVVRFNGGAQAGHNVVTDDGRHHTFAQFGSATFVPGVRTHLAEDVVVHPTALLVEARVLADVGVRDALERLTVAESARVTTPFHQAANRVRELARGPARHGSCGVGVGETVRDALADPAGAVRAGDVVGDVPALRRKVARLRERLREAVAEEVRAVARDPAAGDEVRILTDASVDARWIDAIAPLRARSFVVADDALDRMLRDTSVVFEGAQGVLLDEHVGFHPHTTWSTCTPEPALRLLARARFSGTVTRVGVMRTFCTRHGEGPLPTEDVTLGALMDEPHNAGGGWQGAFRVGWPDLVLARYALARAGGVDALALTHVDRLGALPTWRVADAYDVPGESGAVGTLPDGAPGDLAHQARLTRLLTAASPRLCDVPSPSVVETLEDALGTRARWVSSGPSASAKAER